MNDLGMNTQYGTKWFTFYTKVRPWLVCVGVLQLLTDFFQYSDIYFSYWWLLLYFIVSIANPILGIMVFARSKGNYNEFVKFVKRVLLFESFSMSYQSAIELFLENDYELADVFVAFGFMFLLCFFMWYRLNVKYFERRTGPVMVVDADFSVMQLSHAGADTPNTGEATIFCRKCGEKLIESSRFCQKCGTEIIENTNSGSFE